MPDEDTSQLKGTQNNRVRSHRNWVKKSVITLEEILKANPIDHDLLAVESSMLEERTKRLMDAHMVLCELVDGNEAVDEEDKKLDSLLDQVRDVKVGIHRIQNSVKKEVILGDSTIEDKSKVAPKNSGKLPYIEIKNFTGNPLEWIEWLENFNVSVGNRSEIDDKGKLVYLRYYLDEEPKKLIASIRSTEGNFALAMKTLEERYGRPDVLKETLINQIYDLKTVRENDLPSARKFVDEVHLATGQLESLDVKVNEELGMALILKVRDKLPQSWKQEWARRCEAATKPEEKNYTALLGFLQKELRVREELERSKKNEMESRKNSDNHNKIPTTSALNVSTKRSKKQEVKCTFCGGPHRPRECESGLPISKRLEEVKSKGACSVCAIKGHSGFKCFWKGKCRSCGGRHIDQLCEKQTCKPEQVKYATSTCLMRTASVIINGKVLTTLLADTGGSKTFVRSDIANQCNAKFVRTEYLEIQYFGGETSGNFDVVEIDLAGLTNKESLKVEAVCVPDLGSISFELDEGDVIKKFGNKYLPLAFSRIQDNNLGVLVGENYYDDVIKGATEKMDHWLKATPTIFGWMIHGSGEKENSYRIRIMRSRCVELERFWELEHLGIKDQEQSEAKEDILRDVQCKDNRYWISWPWKEELRPEEHRDLAEARYKRLVQKMTPNEFESYEASIEEMVKQDYFEIAPEKPDGHVSYLPHRPVYKDKSTTTKMRIVFDATAKKAKSLSLNDCLKPGPSLLPKIFGLLLRFRRGRCAISMDLAKAFLQIRLHHAERDVTRFLWNGLIYRSTSVLFGATSSPAILNCVLEYHFNNLLEEQNYQEWVLMKLKEDTYVDDCVTSMDNPEELVEFKKDSHNVFKEASMLTQKERSSVEGIGKQELVGEKTLGIPWNENLDLLTLEIPDTKQLRNKRDLASFLGRVYDPLGLISPLLTPLKIVLQDAWIENFDWDNTFPEEFQKRVDEAVQYVDQGRSYSFPRWLQTSTNFSSSTFHVFVDASQRIYASVIYVRSIIEGLVVVSLLASKAKLVPPKLNERFSPKLELLACWLGSKLAESVVKELRYEGNVFFWTDSKVCIHWINSVPQKWEVYVRNRIKQIQTVPGTWGYVATESNPADIPTRSGVVNKTLWESGPQWLSMEQEFWPQTLASKKFSKEIKEVKAFKAGVKKQDNISYIKEFVQPSVSRWTVLQQAASRIAKLFNCKLDPTHIILRENQKFFFFKEIELLQQNKGIPRSSPISSLFPQLDDVRMLRVGGRLHQANTLTKDVRHPLILHRSGAVDIFVLSIHAKNNHAGTGITLVELRRQGYWLTKGKKGVSSILHTCRVCRRFQAAPFTAKAPPLPNTRVEFCKPFGITGVDLLGPLVVENKKVWIALFTCFQTRAIHLELVVDQSEIGMRRAFERFVARRGLPEEMWSDHGTNFVALSKTIKEVKWKFIVERAPWWGGLWERLVRSVKDLLKRIIPRKSTLDWEQLETYATSVEQVLNSRPISYIWEGDTDQPVPLSPMDFLLFGKIHSEDKRFDVKSFAEEFKQKELWKEDIKKRWENEYLLSVLGNYGKVWKDSPSRAPKVGEVVLVQIENKKRQTWPLARIEKPYFGGDGITRSAMVKFDNSTLIRPIRKLFPLELEYNDTEIQKSDEPCDALNCIHPKESINDWIQCDDCDSWFHVKCLDNPVIDTEKDFICQDCSNKHDEN